MAIRPGDPLRRARRLYRGRVTPKRSREMREATAKAVAEPAARHAGTLLCDYLNRWNDAGPAEVAAAEAAVRQALAAHPESYLAHYAQGFLHRARGQHEASLEAFERTIHYCPEFARAYAQKGEQQLYLGQFKDAIASAQMAREKSPNSSVIGYFDWVTGRACFFMEQYDDAIHWLKKSVKEWPDVWYNRAYLISAYALSGHEVPREVRQGFNRRFKGHAVSHCVSHEEATPSDNPLVMAGRERFHHGLRLAGIPD